MKRAILELGGNINRLDTALDLFKQYPDSLIIISSEGDPKGCLDKLKAAGVPKDQFILDYQAWDTLTNFTTTLPIIQNHQITDLYIVTDLFHITRAMTICEIVYSGTDIKRFYAPHGTDSHKERLWYDALRAFVWKKTGFLWVDKSVKDARMPQIEADKKYAEELLKKYEV